jgi:hypothetical protein
MRKQRLKRLMQELVNWIKRWKALRDLLETISKNLVHLDLQANEDKEKGKHKEKIKRRKTKIKYRQYSCFFLF